MTFKVCVKERRKTAGDKEITESDRLIQYDYYSKLQNGDMLIQPIKK